MLIDRVGQQLFLLCLLAITMCVPLAIVSAERSTSSTAGLYLLWVPYVASLAALIGAVTDAVLRRICVQRAARAVTRSPGGQGRPKLPSASDERAL